MRLTRFLRALRLELDQALRGRSFVSRAVRGQLRPEEVLDLTSQLAFLLYHVGGERSTNLLQLAAADAQVLKPCSAQPLPPLPCLAVMLLGDAARMPYAPVRELGFDVLVAVAGTSWIENTATAVERVSGRPAFFLAELNVLSTRSLRTLDRREPPPPEAYESLIAFAEFGRGAVLGLSSYLDQTWPTPTHVERVSFLRSPSHEPNGERLP